MHDRTMARNVLFVFALASCAAAPSHVRDPQGQPLSTTARLDADTTAQNVHCPDGRTYTIVEPPPPYLAGSHVGTSRVLVTDARTLCATIARVN